jgi:hypothetical protein
MGATSVLGTGPGSAEGASKGARERQTLGVGHLIGPHIVKAGQATCSTGAVSVVFPISGVTADYVVLVTNTDASSPAATSATLAISSGVATVSIVANGSDVVSYAVIKVANFGL